MTNEELVLKYQAGNRDALITLYTNNGKMIEKIIRRFGSLEELDDLRQEAFFGIVKAADLWNPDKDCSFLTYAVYWIKAVIVRYIDECSSVIRIPSNKRALMGRYNKEVNLYRIRFGKYPSDIELRALLEITQEQLENLKADIQASRIRSTSEIVGGENDDLTLEETIAAEGDQYEAVIDQIQHEQLSNTLWSCVDDLSPQQAGVIRRRYKDGRTLKECGTVLGVTPERARQIEQKAISELRKARYAKRLRPYLTDQAAYSMGLKSTDLRSFECYGSSQERAMIRLEDLTGMSLWQGKELYLETSSQEGR